MNVQRDGFGEDRMFIVIVDMLDAKENREDILLLTDGLEGENVYLWREFSLEQCPLARKRR